METRVLVVVGVVAGLLVGLGAGFAFYNSQIVDLKGSMADTQIQYLTIQSQYQTAKTQLESQQADYAKLSAQNQTLTDSVNELRSENQQIQNNFKDIQTFMASLTEDITSLNATFYSYGFLPKAFSRTLSNDQVQSQNVSSQVSLMLKNEPIALAGYGKIYAFIAGFLERSEIIDYPYLVPTYKVVNGTSYISTFEVRYHRTYYETPTEALKYKKGNAVDQGTLQYAMMKNYQENIIKSTQTMYLGVIDYRDGSQGAAVFVPAINSQLTILDPAGGYQTHEGTTTVPKNAASELGIYYNFYLLQKLEITGFTLYDIDTVNGAATVVKQGSLSDIVAFFSS